jgi:hypothetical protein
VKSSTKRPSPPKATRFTSEDPYISYLSKAPTGIPSALFGFTSPALLLGGGVEKWYYAQGGNQQGPVTREALQGLLASRNIPGDALVWCEGMPDWKQAAEVPLLQASSPLVATPAGPYNPYAPPPSYANPVARPAGPIIFPFVKRANFPLAASLSLGGIIGLFGGILGMSSSSMETVGILVAVGGGAALCWGSILFLIYLYRAWHVLQPLHPTTTPGKAVGFLFIPLFNLYWNFVAHWRWSQDWNRNVANFNPGAPRVSEGLFLTYAILQCAGFVAGVFTMIPGFIIYFIIMKGVCDSVNYAAEQHQA